MIYGVQVNGRKLDISDLAAWTGEPEEQLRADKDYCTGEREHWIAWDGALIAGAPCRDRPHGFASRIYSSSTGHLSPAAVISRCRETGWPAGTWQ
jgi:hypothetical protein